MKAFRFQPPYNSKGKTTFPGASKKSGVYLIKENGELVYVGYSGTDLYKTMYRHFQSWSDAEYKGGKAIPAQYRVSYKEFLEKKKYTVRIVFCTAIQAERLERVLIKKYNPRDNANKYEQYQIEFNDTKVYSEYVHTEVIDHIPF